MVRSSRARVAAGVLLVALGLSAFQASVALAASAGVTINNYKFTPGSIDVQPGSTITWTNKQADDDHTVTADDGSFDTGVIAKGGGTATLTFAKEGTFAYHCTIHSSMHGTVVVSATAQQPPATDTAPFESGDPLRSPIAAVALIVLGVGLFGTARVLLRRRA